jgi:hypothetical protein
MARAEESAAAAGTGSVDPACNLPGATLVWPYDCMLNQVIFNRSYPERQKCGELACFRDMNQITDCHGKA